jgi:hypothetical protein
MLCNDRTWKRTSFGPPIARFLYNAMNIYGFMAGSKADIKALVERASLAKLMSRPPAAPAADGR